MEQDLASYEVSSFAVDASRLQFDENGKVKVEDFPAFVHEWWHYIQDISTITGQNGFYLWLRDIIRMTSITCFVLINMRRFIISIVDCTIFFVALKKMYI